VGSRPEWGRRGKRRETDDASAAQSVQYRFSSRTRVPYAFFVRSAFFFFFNYFNLLCFPRTAYDVCSVDGDCVRLPFSGVNCYRVSPVLPSCGSRSIRFPVRTFKETRERVRVFGEFRRASFS
jgi:hypothetical protein